MQLPGLLCFILPPETDEVKPPPPPNQHPSPEKKQENQQRCCGSHRISISVRKRWTRFRQNCRRRGLWNGRWVGFCSGCLPCEDHGGGGDCMPHYCGRRGYSVQFVDIQGTDVVSGEKDGYNNPRIFSYAELYIGTNGFSEKEILGSGGFGRVYRAVLPSDGTVVAVKCVVSKGERFEKTFAAELVAVAQLRHRNLVRLRGWCVNDHQLLLVYDYMPNSSLDRLLFTTSTSDPVLRWDRRRRIVEGLAAALFYIHEQLDTQIIHRDVKTSNVMLDSGYNARLGDFGLARWLEHDEVELSMLSSASFGKNYQFRLTETSRIGGTIGYLPPESFHKQSTVTAKSDVFSFGIVVLEVVTGRRAVDLTYPDDQIILLDFVRRLSDEGRCLMAVDSRLPDRSYQLSEVTQLIHLSLLCSLHDPRSRPTMKWVIEILSGNNSGDLPALPSFRSHPQYMSLSSSTTITTTTTTTTPTTTTTTTPPTTTTTMPPFSEYVTANNTTIYLTANNSASSHNNSRRQPPDFLTVDTPKEIPFREILAITNNFSEAQMAAEMDFGTGYHGYLENRIRVLVKRLGMKTCPALRARFSDELRNLGRLRHRHLVQLRGWCTEQGEMLVVYDYSHSLLSHHLFCHKNPVLPWRHRYAIIKSLASAILYLHEEWDEQVIHRNVTSSAVFLDADMNPRLGCFALAEFLTRNENGHHSATTHLKSSPSVRGIFGYMSPEYMESGEATPMTDVYSFGVVVLEVVSGQMAVDFRWPEVLLVKKVRDAAVKGKSLVDLVDRRLNREYDQGEMIRMVQLGIACTHSDPGLRPSMRSIASILDGNEEPLKAMSRKMEGSEEWKGRNTSSLSLIRRIQALGIN